MDASNGSSMVLQKGAKIIRKFSQGRRSKLPADRKNDVYRLVFFAAGQKVDELLAVQPEIFPNNAFYPVSLYCFLKAVCTDSQPADVKRIGAVDDGDGVSTDPPAFAV